MKDFNISLQSSTLQKPNQNITTVTGYTSLLVSYEDLLTHVDIDHCWRIIVCSVQCSSKRPGLPKDFAIPGFRPKPNQKADYTPAWHPIHHLILINTVTFHKVPISHSFHCVPVHTALFSVYLQYTHAHTTFLGRVGVWLDTNGLGFTLPGVVDFIPTTIVWVRERRGFHMSVPGPISSSAQNRLSPLSPAGCSIRGGAVGVWGMRLKCPSISI